MLNKQQQINNSNHQSVCQAHYNRKFQNNSSTEDSHSLNPNEVVWAYRPLQPESRGMRARERKSTSTKEINKTLDWQILLPNSNMSNVKSVRFSPLRKKESSPAASLRKIPSSSVIHNNGEYGDLQWNNNQGEQNQRVIHSPSRNMLNARTKGKLSLKIEKSPEPTKAQKVFFIDESGPSSGIFTKKKTHTTSSPNIIKKISSGDLPLSTKAKFDLLKENHVEQFLKQNESDVNPKAWGEMRSGRIKQSQSQARLKSILFDDLMKKGYRNREKAKQLGYLHKSKDEETIGSKIKQADRKESLWPWSEANFDNNFTGGDLLITKQAIHNHQENTTTTVIQARKPAKLKKKMVYKIQTLGFESFKDRRNMAESLSPGALTPDKRSLKSPKFRIMGQHYTSSIDLNKTSPESAQNKTSAQIQKEIVVQGSVQIDKRSSTAPWQSASRANMKKTEKNHGIEEGEIIKGHGFIPRQELENMIAQREKLNSRRYDDNDIEAVLKPGTSPSKQRMPDSKSLVIKHLANEEYENASPKYHLLEEPSPFNWRDQKSEFLEKKLKDQLGNGDLDGWEQDSNVSEVDLEAAINQRKGYPYNRNKQPSVAN